MEKLTAISDLFEISLDELVLGKVPTSRDTSSKTGDILNVLEEKVLTTENKKKAGKGLKIAGILLGAVLAVDVISMIIYFVLFGVPK